MRASTSFSLLLAAASNHVSAQTTDGDRVTGKLGDAPQVIDNPIGVAYKAVFPEEAFYKAAFPEGGNIKGEVSAEAAEDGHGVRFTIKLSNLPATGGPFPYHLHAEPVPADGNCTATKAHLDPYQRGQKPPCDSSAPETCEVGDLSGKHGTIPAGQTTFETSYVDLYASTEDSLPSFFGNRSIVIHHSVNSSRITCANFEMVDLSGGDDGEEGGDEGGEGEEGDDEDTGAPCSTVCQQPSVEPSVAPSATAPATTTFVTGTTTEAAPSQTSIVTAGAAGLRAGIVGAGAAVVGVAAAMFML